MKKANAFILIAMLVVALFGCGQRNDNPGLGNMAEPPTRIPDTLEEQFDQELDEGFMACLTSVISYPIGLPTEHISFNTPDRFSISYEIRIVVDNPDYAVDLLSSYPGEVSNFRLISSGNSTSIEATLAVEFEDLKSVFTELYEMGVVEEYRVTVWDMNSITEDDDSEYWHARWAENNTIGITFVENI